MKWWQNLGLVVVPQYGWREIFTGMCQHTGCSGVAGQKDARDDSADTHFLTFYRWRWQSDRYVAVKVNNCDFIDKDAAEHELSVSRCIAKANPSHEGFRYIRT